ncbi:MAG: hypothetical protein DMF94_10270 [Acidobacteria bacterium]|nr:MAG: hypothetical protein DMF94_10270 [Acidobacteriota bacterium]
MARFHFLPEVQAIDMDRLVSKPVADFFSLDEQELFVRAVERVETVDAGEEIVIGQDEKAVAMLTVPPGHLVRCAVAIAVQGMRVGVALVPPAACNLLGREGAWEAEGGQQDPQRKEKCYGTPRIE